MSEKSNKIKRVKPGLSEFEGCLDKRMESLRQQILNCGDKPFIVKVVFIRLYSKVSTHWTVIEGAEKVQGEVVDMTEESNRRLPLVVKYQKVKK